MYVVYLIHMERPTWWGAQHYLGYSRRLESRLNLHQNGHGSLLLRYVRNQGIPFHLVKTWNPEENTSWAARQLELKLKNQTPKRLCPECKDARQNAQQDRVQR